MSPFDTYTIESLNFTIGMQVLAPTCAYLRLLAPTAKIEDLV